MKTCTVSTDMRPLPGQRDSRTATRRLRRRQTRTAVFLLRPDSPLSLMGGCGGYRASREAQRTLKLNKRVSKAGEFCPQLMSLNGEKF